MTKMASPSRILIFPLAAEPNAGLRISIKDYCRTPLLYLGRVPVSFVSATLFLLLWPLRDLKKDNFPLDFVTIWCRNHDMSISTLTSTQLRQAASILEKIETLQNQLNKLHGALAAPAVGRPGRKPGRKPGPKPGPKPGHKRRKISAAGIARIRAAQKARWAKIHAAKGK